jgi:hypothetical protein
VGRRGVRCAGQRPKSEIPHFEFKKEIRERRFHEN